MYYGLQPRSATVLQALAVIRERLLKKRASIATCQDELRGLAKCPEACVEKRPAACAASVLTCAQDAPRFWQRAPWRDVRLYTARKTCGTLCTLPETRGGFKLAQAARRVLKRSAALLELLSTRGAP